MDSPHEPETSPSWSWFIGGTIATVALLVLLGYLLFAYTSIPLR